MYFIGMDLSGPSNSGETAVVAFRPLQKGDLTCHKILPGADDSDIYHFTDSLQPEEEIIVGIDAPLSYNVGGGDRASDADLRRKIMAAGLRPGSVMAPTMTRMVYLTLRGISVARLLLETHARTRIVEVHPGAAMALRGAPVDDVAAFKRSKRSRGNLLAWLERRGLNKAADMKDPTDHYVAACAAALAAWKWHLDESPWLYRAKPPFHPFDYAC